MRPHWPIGDTADFALATDGERSDVQILAGLRVWF